MKIITVIGARPQFIKSSTVTSEIRSRGARDPKRGCDEIVVHTGQHYDANMSRVFFDEMGIPEPQYHLEIGSASHGHMTGRMMAMVEDVLVEEKPDCVLVYGDTNSTLAGALAAAKLNIPVAHVEAGLRSFNRRMPEEINRVLTDHVSDLLFAPTPTAITNLAGEGITESVVQSGDVMLDAFLHFKAVAAEKSRILDTLKIHPGRYCLATVHRQENTDDPDKLGSIFHALAEIGAGGDPVIVPLHPRTRKVLSRSKFEIEKSSGLKVVEAVGYLDMIQLEAHSAMIFTDSGGVQKEAYFAGVPCITLRDETEWIETIDAGANILAGADRQTIIDAFNTVRGTRIQLNPELYGSGQAAKIIVDALLD
jgi:UDP-GlcNAc3NAcA epimerase